MGFSELCGNMVALCYEDPPGRNPEPPKAKKLTRGGIKDNNSHICRGMEYRELCGNTVALCYEQPQEGTTEPSKQKWQTMGGIKIFIPDMRGQWDSGSFVEIWWLCATNTPQEGIQLSLIHI